MKEAKVSVNIGDAVRVNVIAYAKAPSTRWHRGEWGDEAANSRRWCKGVVRLDTHSIRRKALHEHRKAEKRLAGMKQQLKRYHEHDAPGFRSWIHGTFGALLTRQRDLYHAIEEKRRLVLEIQELAERFGLSDVKAYKKAMWRKEHPREAEEEDRRIEEQERKASKRERSDGEDDPFGWNEDDAGDIFGNDEFDIPEEFREILNRVVEEATGIRMPRGERRHASRPEEKSIREVYRTIVRRLHPDHHGEMTEPQKELWHEAQDAYRRLDANALYGILARCDDGEAGLGKHSAVSLILRLTRQLRDAARQARREIRRFKRDPAWNHESRVNDPRHIRRVRFDLEETTRNMEMDSDRMTRILADLERRARQSPRRGRRQPAMSEPQIELPF